GRHILAKGFGKAVVEYKEIPIKLREEGILNEIETDLLREMAGYRNRMVHFYNEISSEELYQICAGQVGDIDKILTLILTWIESHPEMIDKS
ncbi:MAG: HepT-like ribonuclease domain-containing protein, partial [Thermodesulfovibrionia bacterium]|nr:HepT-like ribonuclease domain-containing protein [Thermodesulfovibrionia bacterium]